MEPLFSPQELESIHAYHAPAYLAQALDFFAWPLLLAACVAWLTAPLYAVAQRMTRSWRSPLLERAWQGPDWAPSLVFAVSLFTLFQLLSLPLDVFFGYVWEHRFGLSTMTLGTYVFDWAKAFTVLSASVAALAFGLFGLARRTRWWWAILWVVATLGLVVSSSIDPYRSRLYVDQHPLEPGPLRSRLTEVLGDAHLEFHDIVVEQTSAKTLKLQAFFAGSGPTRTIVLSDSLLTSLSPNEVVAAVAHEAGHVVETRWRGALGATLCLGVLLYVIELLFRRSAQQRWFGIAKRADIRVLPLIILLFDVTTQTVAPISAWYSQRTELDADQFGVALTHDPAAMRSMLRTVARINKLDPDPPWWIQLRQTHPPIRQRLQALPP